MSCGIYKLIGRTKQEKVILENLLSLAQFLLCLFKVKVDVEGLDEIGDWVAILIALLPDDAYQVLELLLVLI